MTATAKFFMRQPRFAEIISAMVSEMMKIIRYIRPTSRWTQAHQERETDFEDIAFTVVEGVDGLTFDNAVRMLRRGNVLLVQDLNVFARRRDTICERVRAVFSKGASIVVGSGKEFTPDQEDPLIEGIMTGGYLVKEPKQRVAHNRIDDERRAKAFEYWQQKDLTNAQVERLSGISYQTMFKWWQAEFPREQRKGRPRSKK